MNGEDTSPRALETHRSFPPSPSSVPLARAHVRAALLAWGLEAAADSAELVVSELATNVVLHAHTDFAVRVRRFVDGVLLEVVDASPVLPELGLVATDHETRSPLSRDSVAALLESGTTGRGLQIVERLSDRWGIRRDGASKVVWSLLGGSGGERLEGDADPPQGAPQLTGRLVRLAAVPLRLVIESEVNLDTLMRELQLLTIAGTAASPLDELVSALGRQLERRRVEREQVQHVVRDALVAGDRLVDLEIVLPDGALEALRELETLLARAARPSADGLLLAVPPSAEVRAFRRWEREEVERQWAGETAVPCPFIAHPRATPIDLATALGPTAERLLADLGARIGAQRGDGVVRHLFDVAREALGASQATLWRREPESGRVALAGAFGLSESFRALWPSFSLSDAVPGAEVMRTGLPLALRTPLERKLLFPEVDRRAVVPDATIVVLPLPGGAEPLGCVSFSFSYTRDFNAADYALLGRLVACIAPAIGH